MLPFFKKAVFELPNGPKNLAALFPAIDWSQVSEYTVVLKTTADAVLVTGPLNKTTCCCNEDTIRLVFENALGKWDAVNFSDVGIVTEVTSSGYQKALPFNFSKMDSGQERFNVKMNRNFTAMTTCYKEEDQPWLMELAGSSKVFMQRSGKDGQPDTFLPLVILDGKFNEKKNTDDRYIYPFTIQFKLSNSSIVIRN